MFLSFKYKLSRVLFGRFPAIQNFMVCNVYWEDYAEQGLAGPACGKFLITFRSLADIDPAVIKTVKIKGPNDFLLEIPSQAYDAKRQRGLVYDPLLKLHFLMALAPGGFLENGNYRLELTYSNGKTLHREKSLETHNDLIRAWTAQKDQLSNQFQAGFNGSYWHLKWPVLKNHPAYYCTRIAKAGALGEFYANLVYADNILGWGHGNPLNTGRNKSSIRVPAHKLKDDAYLWMTEIMDHNNLDLTTQSVLCPVQMIRKSSD